MVRSVVCIEAKVSLMKKLRFLLSLTNDDNDYQIEQASAARLAAGKLGVELEILSAHNEGIVQSQQLLEHIQSSTVPRPDAILMEPAGSTALPQVARAAAAAGIAWVVLNRDVDYTAELRRLYHVPVFTLTSDHEEIGRIQGRQLTALLPEGGLALYIQGPSESIAAKQRYIGLADTKPANLQLRILKAQWTEASAQKAVNAWLRLSTARETQIHAICAQDDSMAIGARKAFEQENPGQRESWLRLPFLGCDGLPKTGQSWVRSNLLTATIFIPPNAGVAMEMVMRALEGGPQPPERTLTAPKSIPEIEVLAKSGVRRGAGLR